MLTNFTQKWVEKCYVVGGKVPAGDIPQKMYELGT
jgi:hypothetical protein